ncbi:uncharacterized protein K444DRAFT_613948 [Hyaloscypha bicolor E]|uniref:Uncharacterized protein n=1 Tax=Hyaloscypha bicolor E TaxID=1095630 RepID=A0A2J6T810_9HELO|nr:uncharacterized protein K444DRAFT_613948 [Hyaloscypha bicolor E]PMD59154.1 hypothetical protein K444DRAFT_613948 [Hyaloscypha bicolor E]
MPKGWLHGDIEISGTSTPWVSGGTAVEPASNTSTSTSTLHRPSSTFRQPSLACGLAHA